MAIVNYNQCPWTSTDGKTNTITYDTTENLNFPGGWKPDTSSDPALNPYGGTYSYSQDPNTGEYKLKVVPNFSALSWVGTAPACSNNTREACYAFKTVSGSMNNRPTQWAGYASTSSTDTSKSLLNGMVRTPALGCNTCQGGNMVLCTSNQMMDKTSCPGYGKFSKEPIINNDETNFYDTEPLSNYPRGVGYCYYPKDIIKTDDDLRQLGILKNDKKIHPDLADELAINYCYDTSPDNRTCGKDGDGANITTCTRFKADLIDPNSAQKPCVSWMNSLLYNGRHIDKIDTKSKEWCSRDTNKDTPLCDCLQRESCMNTSTCPTNARKFYKLMSTEHNNIITTGTPPECWYKPCYKNLSYAIPIEKPGQCTTYANICNQISNLADKATMQNNQQYLSCTLDAKTGTGTTDSTPTDPIASKNKVVVIVVAVVALVVIGTVIIPLFSTAAVTTAATVATPVVASVPVSAMVPAAAT